MEVVAVPTKLEDNFVLQNGDKGTSIQEAFKFNIDKVSDHPNALNYGLSLSSSRIR